MEGGAATSPSTVVVSGVVTGIRLLVVIVLKRVLKAVMITGYTICLTGSGLRRGIQNRLHVDAMGQYYLVIG